MTAARGGGALYTPEVLALAVALSDFPISPDMPCRGEAVSRVCGSRMAIAIATDQNGAIESLGAMVSACAIGQAAAAIFLQSAKGYALPALIEAHDAIEGWLLARSEMPAWHELAMLERARGYPGRHGAILLPWKAAIDALSKTSQPD